jgi:hypothetical protein
MAESAEPPASATRGAEIAPLVEAEPSPAELLRKAHEELEDADARLRRWEEAGSGGARARFDLTVQPVVGGEGTAIVLRGMTADRPVSYVKEQVHAKKGPRPDEQRLFTADEGQTVLEDETLPIGTYDVGPGGFEALSLAMQSAAEAAARRTRRVAERQARAAAAAAKAAAAAARKAAAIKAAKVVLALMAVVMLLLLLQRIMGCPAQGLDNADEWTSSDHEHLSSMCDAEDLADPALHIIGPATCAGTSVPGGRQCGCDGWIVGTCSCTESCVSPMDRWCPELSALAPGSDPDNPCSGSTGATCAIGLAAVSTYSKTRACAGWKCPSDQYHWGYEDQYPHGYEDCRCEGGVLHGCPNQADSIGAVSNGWITLPLYSSRSQIIAAAVHIVLLTL